VVKNKAQVASDLLQRQITVMSCYLEFAKDDKMLALMILS